MNGWLGHLEKMDETSLTKRVREEKVPGHMKRGRPKKFWDEVVKEDMKKRGLCINDAQDRMLKQVETMLQKSGRPGYPGKRSYH